jgi:hypothetical protein
MRQYPPPVPPQPDNDGALRRGDVEVFDGVAGLTLGDTLLTLWQTPARPERIRQVTEWTEALIAETPGTIAACQFLLSTASPPNSAARAEALRGFRLVEPHARRLITVPLGDAVWHSIVRGIIRAGVAAWGRHKLIKVAASRAEAFDLLTEIATPRSPGRAELEAGLAALDAALGGAP